MASNSRRKSTMKSPILVTQWQKRSLVNPHIFRVKVIGIVPDNLSMYVFSIDIPLKVARALEYEVQGHSGVIFAQRCQWHQCAMCSRDIREKVGCIAVSMTCTTAVSLTPLCNKLCRLSLRIWSHIRKGFNQCIRGPGEVVWWKKTEVENLVSGSLKAYNRDHNAF
jgi:hypothetical protein